MREVLCNTSPLLYLHQLGRLELLPSLYGRVTIPIAIKYPFKAVHIRFVGTHAQYNAVDAEKV